MLGKDMENLDLNIADIVKAGFKFNMSDIHASIGIPTNLIILKVLRRKKRVNLGITKESI